MIAHRISRSRVAGVEAPALRRPRPRAVHEPPLPNLVARSSLGALQPGSHLSFPYDWGRWVVEDRDKEVRMGANRPLVISHAACKGHAPENTLAGIRAALELGCEAIEIDVHTTVDGVPVLLHDDTLDRTTDGKGDVRGMPLAELQRLDAGARTFGDRFAGERVPTLEQALAL